jgi:hypothetical protein
VETKSPHYKVQIWLVKTKHYLAEMVRVEAIQTRILTAVKQIRTVYLYKHKTFK